MSTAIAQSHHIFGFRPNISGNINYMDEQTIVFPSGNQVVRFNIDQKQQKFIPGSDKCNGMTAIALSPNRRYIAVAEKGEKPSVTVYDLLHDQSKKRKTLSAPELQTHEFVSLAFSPDSKYLIAQGGRPDWILVYWAWEKSKIMANMKTTNQAGQPVYQISFNPQDNTQICVIGNHIFKLFRYAEGNLKQFGFQKMEPQNFLSHAWVSDERVVVGSDTGRLLLFENGELKSEFYAAVSTGLTAESSSVRASVSMIPEDSLSASGSGFSSQITSIVAHSKGFACSGGAGMVHLFEKTDEKDFYHKTRLIKIPPDPHSTDPTLAENQVIVSLTVSPSEEMLVAATDQSQLFSISMSSADLGKGEQASFEPLTHSFHSSTITGLDICIRKPLIATCSLDHSVRIWNYETNSLELYKVFQEEAYSIALHPSGLYILVGFSDKLRLMNILIDDIRIFKELTIRGCRECAFSNGGHLFAAVHGNVIQVYSSTTFENVSNLKGHNGKVRSIAWSADDSKLISSGMDGAVYEWSAAQAKRVNEVVLKTCAYSGVTVSPNGKHTYAVGSDKSLKEITESQIMRTVDSNGITLTQVAMSHSGRMLFCGTVTGALRSIKFPLTDAGEYTEHQAHASQISKMKITYDDQYLITVSEDACLMIWRVSDKEGRGVKHDRDVPYAEEILITKSDLEEKNQLMSELKTRVEELKMENEYQLRLKDMNYNEKIKELTEKFIQEMENLKTKNQVLKTEKEKEIAKHEEELAEVVDKHSKDMQDLESTNNQKLMLEYEKYQELQAKSQRMQEDYERQLQDADEGKEQALEELTEYYETKLQEKSSQLEQANDEARQQQREYEETKRQIEEDADREILDIKNKYERRLRDEIETNMRLKGESGIMRKKFNSLNKEIDSKNEEIKTMQQEKQKLENVIKSLEKDIHGLKKEIQERDETIQDKEKRIYDLKKKNQELEKFKFVLDYKIKELKKQIEPRENDIKAMKEQIQEMESELERFHKQNTQLELNITELKQKLKATDRELHHERQRVRDTEAVIKIMKTDIHNCVGFLQEPKKLKESIKKIYDTHVHDDSAESVSVDTDIQKEYSRQREHLERSVASYRKKLAKDTEIHRADNVRIMQENVSLIKEINDLRRELKLTRTQVHDLEASLGTNRSKIAPGKNAGKRLETATTMSDASGGRSVVHHNFEEEAPRIIDMQKMEIRKLRNQIMNLDEQLARRPPSGGKLPPMVLTQ
ncbi:cilia- and flagella-associated protein 57-like [Clavelina lepadiformis]|uniref:cilia- and flagella-associated protein 57-like n=1 Tax=Clavelina lepadiformis TaxID=159417 RepID=UPI0040423A84